MRTLEPTDEDDPIDEMSLIEARLEHLAEVAERCRKIILASRLAIAGGVALLLVMLLGLSGSMKISRSARSPRCWAASCRWGSNVSTLRQTRTRSTTPRASVRIMIDRKHLRVVGDTDMKRI